MFIIADLISEKKREGAGIVINWIRYPPNSLDNCVSIAGAGLIVALTSNIGMQKDPEGICSI